MATPSSAQPGTPGGDPNASEYSMHERVLCFHGPLIYEAKVLKALNMEEPSTVTGVAGWHYFVHYKGWKQTWDEWVPASRLMKNDEKGLSLQKTLQQQHSSHSGGSSVSTAAKSTKGAAAGSKTDGNVSATGGSSRLGVRKDARGTKRGRDEDDSAKKPEMKLNVPELLKQKLVDDWEWVTKEQRTVPLPRDPAVETILKDFEDYVVKEKPANLREPELLGHTVRTGIQCYFDRALGSNLLYRFERKQYADIRKKYFTGQDVIVGVSEREMSAIYGAEHLLRMIVSLPAMVVQSSLDPDSVSLIRDYVNELLQYMWRERDRIFLKEYQQNGPTYQNVIRG